MYQTTELVLVVSDMNVPYKINDIPEQFKNILVPNKIQHVLSLGNIGNKESYDWLKGLSNNFHGVKGNDYDDQDKLQETKVVSIGDLKIGLVHGHQTIPWGDTESLSIIQKQLGTDILLSGATHINSVTSLEGKYYINPGSISGSYSPINPCPNPSFTLLVIQGDFCVVYSYELTDNNKKIEVSKLEFSKNSNVLKNLGNVEEEEEIDEDV